jgi:hypothetical protein
MFGLSAPLVVAQVVEVRAVDRQEVRNLRYAHHLPTRVRGTEVENVDGRIHPLLERSAGPDVEVLGIAVGCAVILDHLRLHRSCSLAR